VLSNPDDATLARLPALWEAVATLPPRLADPLRRVLRHLGGRSPADAAAHYVDTFDLRRRCCLYLSYYTHGDTRRRGLALLRFRAAYRAAGLTAADDELPDHLAIVLEFSALGHSEEAVDLLVAHRPGLDLLWRALDALGTSYADALLAVRATLPPPAPTELVGLAPTPVEVAR